MNEYLSPSAQRVQEALAARGLECVVVELPASTRTAPEAAQAIGCTVGQIVKSLVFRSKETHLPVLVLTSGPNRVNEAKIGILLGHPIEKADAGYVREQTGFAVGGVPPVGHLKPLPTFIDEDLLRYDDIWAAAGTPHAVFRLKASELQPLTDGRVASIT